MTVNFEPDELRQLIELAYLGEWMVNAHHDADHQDDSSTERVQQLLAAAKLPGIGQDAESGQYFLESDWSDKLYEKYILDYDDHVFWDELTERLAQRDLAKRRGVGIDTIDRDEDILELRPLEERYRRELEQHGVDHLELGGEF
jgi:hypothetical protein